jgi:translation initiation factor IF-1
VKEVSTTEDCLYDAVAWKETLGDGRFSEQCEDMKSVLTTIMDRTKQFASECWRGCSDV